MKSVLVLLLTGICACTFGQFEIPSFGVVTNDERNLKECNFDKSAVAVVLLDVAQSTHDEEWALITTNRVKYKILKESGIPYGDISIYYETRDDYEVITDIEAVVHTTDENGAPLSIPLDKKSVFRNRVDENHSVVKIALPRIKVGTIFEYSYTSRKRHWGRLRGWYFQHDVPTVFSKWDVNILPGLVFQYFIHKSPSLPIDIKNPPNEGRISFAMNNIPGLKDEPYMDAPRDYIQRVDFEIAEYPTGNGNTRKVGNTWQEIKRDLESSPEFGRAIEKNLGKDIEILKQVATLNSEFEKMKALHNYVRKNFTWNGRYALYAIDGIRKAWDRKSGNAGDINLTLINLLKDAGLQVDPLLVSERDHGKVNPEYPSLGQFNKVVAYVTIAGKNYVLDGTDLVTPTEMIPFELLNTKGVLITKKNLQTIILKDDKRILKSIITVNSTLNEQGELKGNVNSSDFDYLRLDKAVIFKKEGAANFAEKYLLKKETDFKIDSLVVTNVELDSLPLSAQYSFKASMPQSGDYRLVSLDLFNDLTRNPFVSDIRFTNIDFGTVTNKFITQVIYIPASMKPDAMPKNITLVMPDKSISFARASSYDDKSSSYVIRLTLEINKPVFTAEEYPAVKEFFKKMMDMMKEQLVLKKK